MASSSLLDPEARSATARVIATIEAQTSAEVVVAVRRQSGDYRAVDWLVGAVAAFGSLLLLLFLPQSFAVEAMPLDVLLFFLLGAVVSTRSPGLQRLLTTPTSRRERLHLHAQATFVSLGVSRTRARVGLLVYVSLLERSIEVVPDLGVDLASLGSDWLAWQHALTATLAGRSDLEAFDRVLGQLGPLLARILPPTADDTDELPNAVSAP